MSEFDASQPHGSDADPHREVLWTPESASASNVPTDAEQITVTKAKPGKRKLVKEKPPKEPKKKRSVARRITYWVIGVITLSVLAYGGFYGYIIWKAEHNIRHSHALPHYSGLNDILIMGLDTRRDENNKPVNADIYNALHLGDSDVGQNDSNVLMYVHIPKDGSKAVAISIPRDDWVDIPGCKSDVKGLPSAARMRYYVGSYCKGKIKSAYGWALAAAQDEGKSFQEAKDIARKAEILTVENFLKVKITGFVEVTMVAFFQMAEQIGKIQVCVKEDTEDYFSGAKFHAGKQWVNASQAVSFVRQRRDLHNRYNFTDLDRSRRQQAFIVSLLTQLKSAGTLLNPIKLNGIVDVASSNVVLSDGLDVINAAKLASNLSGGNLHFYTLPVVAFKDYQPSPGQPYQNANQVDVPKIRAIVANLINPKATVTKPKPTPKPSASPTPLPSGSGYTVNVANASTINHKASDVLDDLASRWKYTQGKATTAARAQSDTTIEYNPADVTAAKALAQRFTGAVTLVASSSVAAKTFDVTLGSALATLSNPVASASSKPSSTTTKKPTKVPSAVSATGGGTNGPAITDLTDLGGAGIPCVK